MCYQYCMLPTLCVIGKAYVYAGWHRMTEACTMCLWLLFSAISFLSCSQSIKGAQQLSLPTCLQLALQTANSASSFLSSLLQDIIHVKSPQGCKQTSQAAPAENEPCRPVMHSTAVQHLVFIAGALGCQQLSAAVCIRPRADS